MTFLMNKAWQDYYSDLISNNSNDLHHLFKVSKNLLNIASTPVLPLHEDKQQLANEMGAFFIRKIANIRSDLDNHPPQVCSVGSNDCKIDLPISKFNLLSQQEVHDLIRASNKKTCCVDPIPTKLVLGCLDILLAVITKIINYSLEHGVFPSVWKNALVFPLLKKDGLESAAFDTIDHGILLERLRSAFGVRDTALSWFASYLSGRTQQVSSDGTLSTKFELECGVPQGSCLGPLLFVVDASKIFEIVGKHNLEIYCYADDSQLYLSFCPNDNANKEAALVRVERCIEDIRN